MVRPPFKAISTTQTQDERPFIPRPTFFSVNDPLSASILHIHANHVQSSFFTTRKAKAATTTTTLKRSSQGSHKKGLVSLQHYNIKHQDSSYKKSWCSLIHFLDPNVSQLILCYSCPFTSAALYINLNHASTIWNGRSGALSLANCGRCWWSL